jgi:cellobiose phosphorylase
LSFTLEDGRCLRQYSLPKKNGEPGRADVRPFIDQGVWVISTITTYLRLTGDVAFLDEECGYHRLTGGRVVPSPQSGSVMGHLRRILSYLLAQLDPRTGCLHALYGDWNDALDGLGILPGGGDGYGNGVSVMASLQLLQNLREMQSLLQLQGLPSHAAEVTSLRAHEESLASALWLHAVDRAPDKSPRIMHGWGHDGTYRVGSFDDADGAARDSLTSNAFWVLCGMLDRHPETRPAILSAFDRLDSKYGLRTFQPCFPSGDGRFGRIGKLPPGTAENAGTYVHATAFGIMALFEMGEARLAWEQLAKVLPFTPLHRNLSHSPFVMPNSYGYNPDLGIDGQNMNDWQTGSSNVLFKTILRHAIGFRMEWDDLVLWPANWSPFRRWEIAVSARGRRFQIHYEDKGQGRRTIDVNGVPQQTHFHPQDKTHGIRLKVKDLPQSATVEIRIID